METPQLIIKILLRYQILNFNKPNHRIFHWNNFFLH